MAASLQRAVFSTSRLAEFASVEELVKQINHPVADWPIVALKELVDNALDSCERAGVAPVIAVTADKDRITVQDNGDGIDPDVVARIVNYAAKTSSNAMYVSPTRGQQGNAFQTLLAMNHAVTGLPSETIIESRGVRHSITFSVDAVSQEPVIAHEREAIPQTSGTSVSIVWRGFRARSQHHDPIFGPARKYQQLNPHLSIKVISERSVDLEATNPDWQKWLPTDRTPAHWYDGPSFRKLVAAEVNRGRGSGQAQRSVFDFVSEFGGLSGSAKPRAVCEAAEATRMPLNVLYDKGPAAIDRLLDEMKGRSQPAKVSALGALGRDHVMTVLGGETAAARYKKVELDIEGVPYLIEVGFGYLREGSRNIVLGLNWSISVVGNPFEQLGHGGLDAVLVDLKVQPSDPVSFFLHVACPRFSFVDKGKSKISLPRNVDLQIVDAIRLVTKEWTRQKKAEEQNARARFRRHQEMLRLDRPMNIKEAAYSVMRKAYMEASDNGTLPANARQIMYAARPEILALTGQDVLSDQYFTQTLLVNYMQENEDECTDWDVVFSARGHFEEPHTRRSIGLGTLEVRKYLRGYGVPVLADADVSLASVETHGPEGRYGGVLFLEKEGFAPLLARAQIAERYDLAIMSTKGMSVTAARELVDQTCARYGIPLFILHDFDVSGFTIASTLHQSNRRYQFSTASGRDFQVIDFGLRLDDVERMDLQSEPTKISGDLSTRANHLRRAGATQAERDFLLGDFGKRDQRRVELNAMSSRQFIDHLEAKLKEHGVKKTVPSADQLSNAYRLFVRGAKARRVAEEALRNSEHDPVDVPADLDEQVRAYLAEHPEEPWDDAVEAICRRA